ncbi:hypothetical protein [Mycobacterium malmoense]|uniref:hypothetical protein n=1 Tax=Mycobacterium malmoense TaxID=1780 RepID=UPI0011328024|nr:hypothetical protein [Mycobacterium malmoense]
MVDATTGGSLLPRAREPLLALRSRGVGVLLWSSGGATSAWRRARQTGIADLVDSTCHKIRDDPSSRWELPEALAARVPAVSVDDMPVEVRRCG